MKQLALLIMQQQNISFEAALAKVAATAETDDQVLELGEILLDEHLAAFLELAK